MTMGIIQFILPIWAAFLIVEYLGGEPRGSGKGHRLLYLNLAIGLGVGMSSCTYFVRLFLFYHRGIFSDAAEISFYVVMILSVYLLLRQTGKKEMTVRPETLIRTPSRIYLIQAAFGIILLLFLAQFLLISLNDKHGTWDAWAIWNMRARFLFRAGAQWAEAFSGTDAMPHTDYPLLLPLNIAKVWHYSGNDSVAIPVAFALLFTLLTIGLLLFSLADIRSTNHGLLAGVVLISFTKFAKRGASQCADIPFGFYLLATIVFFYLHQRSAEKNKGFLVLAGAMAGLAAWTKNEGMLLILTVMTAHFAVALLTDGWKSCAQQGAAFILGLLPGILIIASFKLQLAPPNDLVAGQSMHSTLSHLFDFSRYSIVSSAFVDKFFELTKVRLLIFPALLLLLGRWYPDKFKKCNYFSALVVLLMLSGYFFVYVTTPHDLAWHLRTSLERLYLHLLPSVIFTFFVILKMPESLSKS